MYCQLEQRLRRFARGKLQMNATGHIFSVRSTKSARGLPRVLAAQIDEWLPGTCVRLSGDTTDALESSNAITETVSRETATDTS